MNQKRMHSVHSFFVVIEAQQLMVHWYDPEGCFGKNVCVEAFPRQTLQNIELLFYYVANNKQKL